MKVIIQSGDPLKLIWSSPTTFFFPERYILHPKLQVEFVEDMLRDITVNEKYHKAMFKDETIYIITNSDHIINRFRNARKSNEITDLIIEFFPFNSDKFIIINTDSNGTFSKYPEDFQDEWGNQLMNLI
jgi:predicted ATPase